MAIRTSAVGCNHFIINKLWLIGCYPKNALTFIQLMLCRMPENLKERLKKEGNESVTNCHQLKLVASRWCNSRRCPREVRGSGRPLGYLEWESFRLSASCWSMSVSARREWWWVIRVGMGLRKCAKRRKDAKTILLGAISRYIRSHRNHGNHRKGYCGRNIRNSWNSWNSLLKKTE